MIRAILLVSMFATTPFLYALDSDYDGVADQYDRCPNTPFMDIVDANGCSLTTLLLPEEKAKDTIILRLRYAFGEEEENEYKYDQRSMSASVGYYMDDWRYQAKFSAYEEGNGYRMGDTTLKIKKRFRPIKRLRLYPGIGIKLPTDRYMGNRTDYKGYLSFSYSASRDFSLFGGYTYTVVNDKSNGSPLRNTHAFYAGAGYFFTDDWYIDFSVGATQSKYIRNGTYSDIGVSLFYQVSSKIYLQSDLSVDPTVEESYRLGISLGIYLR